MLVTGSSRPQAARLIRRKPLQGTRVPRRGKVPRKKLSATAKRMTTLRFTRKVRVLGVIRGARLHAIAVGKPRTRSQSQPLVPSIWSEEGDVESPSGHSRQKSASPPRSPRHVQTERPYSSLLRRRRHSIELPQRSATTRRRSPPVRHLVAYHTQQLHGKPTAILVLDLVATFYQKTKSVAALAGT